MTARDELPAPRLIEGERPVKIKGSALARGLMRLFGWQTQFHGLPAKQGVILVYPHTSNWDFVLGVMAKWAFGLQVKFWGKDSLFAVPLFGRWVRWIGGVAVNRKSSTGTVGDTAAYLQQSRERDEFFWLAVAPEGTRSLTTGWRSGAYQVALQAKAPVGLACFDFGSRTVHLTHFVELSGNPEADFALFAQCLKGHRGKRPGQASPIQLRA